MNQQENKHLRVARTCHENKFYVKRLTDIQRQICINARNKSPLLSRSRKKHVEAAQNYGLQRIYCHLSGAVIIQIALNEVQRERRQGICIFCWQQICGLQSILRMIFASSIHLLHPAPISAHGYNCNNNGSCR